MIRIAIPRADRLADYEEAVRRAGGEPIVVDPADYPPANVVQEFDGVLLPGGGDIEPATYGEIRHASFSPAETGRDEYELSLVRHVLEVDLPLFAICRGIQVLNVARGGTLVQDIPSQLPDAGPHRVAEPRTAIAHTVTIAVDSLLDHLIGGPAGDLCPVNSRHHQSVKGLGAGLVVSGEAPDGVIEAVEDPSQQFCLGVQWHPENFWRTDQFAALFRGFIEAAGRKSRKI